MKTKINFILRIFLLFLVLTISSFWGFSQELYYWSNGEKIKLVEDRSSMVVYEKENQKLIPGSSVKIKEIKNFSNKVLGNYNIVKYSDTTTLISNAFAESSIKSKKYGLISEKGDTIYLSHVILMKFKPGYEYNDIQTILTQYNAGYISTDYNIIKFYVESIDNVINAANKIYESGKVEWCHPDFLVNMERNFEPKDRQYYVHNKYHYCGAFGKDINVVKAWEITKGCSNIIVAVIDDGVEDHPALKDGSGNSRVLPGFTPSGITVNGRPGTGDAHGQCCAGIIAASHSTEVRGIAPNIMILPVKIRFGVGIPSSEYADAINWAWDQGNADILSNSWGPGDYDAVRTAINNAQTLGRGRLGSIVAFSSGNDGANQVNAAAKVCIAVGAINKYDTPAERLRLLTNRRYTNIGSDLDLVAYGGDVDASIWTPADGGDIRTIDRTGSNGYESGNYTDNFSGTSAACPQVSGAAALILSVNPNLTRTEVENILFTTATDLGSIGKDNTYGYGKLNVYAALLEAIKTRNERFELSNGYLAYSKFRENFKMSFTGTPGCGVASGIYFCDVYKAEATIPYSNVFLYEGDGLSGANPNSGEYYVNVTNNGSTLTIFTFFYYVKTNSIGQTVNKWVPFDPSSSWTRKYSVSPPSNIVFNGTVASGQSKDIYATNSIRLTTGFKAANNSYFRAARVAPSGSISCLPNPSKTITLKSENIDNELVVEEKAIINEEIQKDRSLTIYPNPSDGNFYIKLSNEVDTDARIEIFDVGGKIVYKTALYNNEQNIIFTNTPGYYIIKVFNGQDYYTDKLLLK